MPSHENPKRISVIIPLHNEEAAIDQLRQKLMPLVDLFSGAEIEFVFVDDGSSDATAIRLCTAFANHKNCRFVAHERNYGVGAAFRTGFSHATGDIVCTIDADCSYEPQDLGSLVEALQRYGADVAVASPYHPQGRVDGVARWRIFVSKACSMLYRQISPVRLYTYTSIFRAYRSHVTKTARFTADGFLSAVEILMCAAELGYRIVEVPMVLRPRKTGLTKMPILRTIFAHLRLMSQIATSHPVLGSSPFGPAREAGERPPGASPDSTLAGSAHEE